jgi:hypothetical protein
MIIVRGILKLPVSKRGAQIQISTVEPLPSCVTYATARAMGSAMELLPKGFSQRLASPFWQSVVVAAARATILLGMSRPTTRVASCKEPFNPEGTRGPRR